MGRREPEASCSRSARTPGLAAKRLGPSAIVCAGIPTRNSFLIGWHPAGTLRTYRLPREKNDAPGTRGRIRVQTQPRRRSAKRVHKQHRRQKERKHSV